MVEETFLDKTYLDELRLAVFGSKLFNDARYAPHYRLFCVGINRLETCIEYLNEHSSMPETEHDFMIFVMFFFMIIEAIKELHRRLDIPYHYHFENQFAYHYRFFSHLFTREQKKVGTSPRKRCIYIDEDKSLTTDDAFISYFRALVFAHPFKTSYVNFLNKGEIHFSPWVITNDSEFPDEVGLKIYSNMTNNKGSDELTIVFSFETLKDYIKSRYILIRDVTNWINNQMEKLQKEWRKRKVNRKGTTVEVLKDVASIVSGRHDDILLKEVNETIGFLTCELTAFENATAVSFYRRSLEDCLPFLCWAVDDADHLRAIQTLQPFLNPNPENLSTPIYFQRQKIFEFLSPATDHQNRCNEKNCHCNQCWGRELTELFANGFACDYVLLEPNKMSSIEMRLLVTTALYMAVNKDKEDG